MAHNIKLTYFDVKARGEPARLVLAYAGVDFEDIRVKPEEWPTLKPKQPYGQLPVLEFDGKILATNHAITRFLGREFGIAGRNSFEMAEVDEVVDMVSDLFNKRFPLMFEKDEAKKAAGLKTLVEVTTPPILEFLEKRMKERGGGQFLVGNSLTYADLYLYYFCSEMTKGSQGLTATPKLASLVERVGNLPNIRDWVNRRPKSLPGFDF